MEEGNDASDGRRHLPCFYRLYSVQRLWRSIAWEAISLTTVGKQLTMVID
jgi:hypothetical protein